MFNFVATGTVILMTQNLGANQHEKACEIGIVSIGANLIIGLILRLTMVICSKYILHKMKYIFLADDHSKS